MTVNDFLLLNEDQQRQAMANESQFNRGLDAAAKYAADPQGVAAIASTVKLKELENQNDVYFVLENTSSTSVKGVFYDPIGDFKAKTDAIVATDGNAGTTTSNYYEVRSFGVPLIHGRVEIELLEGSDTVDNWRRIQLWEGNYPHDPTPDKRYSESQIKTMMNVSDVTTSGETPMKYADGPSIIEFTSNRAYYCTIPPNSKIKVTLYPRLEGNAFSVAK